MKLYEYAVEMMMSGHNGKQCIITVQSPETRETFHLGGFNGLVNQIPAYLGGCEVKQIVRSDSIDKLWI